MNELAPGTLYRGIFTRRRMLRVSLGAGLFLSFSGSRALAQETTETKDPAAVPANAVAWPKYNLNTASSAEFKSIPGATEIMRRELEMYRPYSSIGQFRDEIRKTISAEEIADLEAYVFVPVEPNRSDVETLRQLPGVSSELALVLIAGRPYDSPATFLATMGASVSPELVSAAGTFIVPYAGTMATWPKYNLNTAARAQLRTIPGAAEGMTREFEEYRHYTSIEQFRAEMGKYISPGEVSALEKYLFVPISPGQADIATMQQLPGLGAEGAKTIAAEGPFDSVESFLAVLETTIAPPLVDIAKTYVVAA